MKATVEVLTAGLASIGEPDATFVMLVFVPQPEDKPILMRLA